MTKNDTGSDTEQSLAALQKQLQKIRIPAANDRVFKDECVFSFDSPETETGLYVCLSTFLGFGRQHVEKHYANTDNAVFLHIKRIKTLVRNNPFPVPQSKVDSEGNQQAKRLAIGLDGGFDLGGPKYDTEERFQLVILPDFLTISLPNVALPLKVSQSIEAVQKSNSARIKEELKPWDGEQRFATKHAENLFQVDHPPKISPISAHWKCEHCEVTQNLWLNLSDGKILCGRKNFDGSGGNNHAIEHYKQVKYPLAAKLGTITPTGADVYSYDEDDMVMDPNLAVHLSHFGINIQTMEKTEKNMAEMELDLNQKYDEWSVLQESEAKLQPLFGPGFTGMINLGNSCYLNSVMQVLFALTEFKAKYFFGAEDIFSKRLPVNPADDLTIQMAKLAVGLWSGSHSKPPSDLAKDTEVFNQGIKPFMFKSLIGKDHPEFGTKRQQDAEEFFRHLLTLLERSTRSGKSVADSFSFRVEDRVQCQGSSKVRYSSHHECVWALPIPMEAATNKHEVALYEEKKAAAQADGRTWEGDVIRSTISLQACLHAFAASDEVQDFYSTALSRKTKAIKTMRFGSFPDYLFIQLKKFTVGADWTPKKLDVSVDMPLVLDIAYLRGYGKKPDEELLPEEDETPAQLVQIDETLVRQLMEMGFSKDSCMRAAYCTGSTGVENAMNWIMEHLDDADINMPFIVPGTAANGARNVELSEGSVEMILGMGFTREQAIKALTNTDDNVERAIDWLFSHPDDPRPAAPSPDKAPAPEMHDGPGAYRLRAFISHMGTSTSCGHYVCHVLKDDRWVIYNDEKVAQSEKPPKDLGYLYLYERMP